MRIVLSVLSVAASCVVGWIWSGKYDERVAFLRDYRAFLTYAEGEILFLKKRWKDVAADYAADKKGTFVTFLKNDPEKNARRPEEKLVTECISKIRTSDYATLKSIFSYEEKKTDALLAEREKAANVNGKLIKKLCPLIGIALVLLTL